MGLFSEFKNAVKSYSKAFAYIKQHSLWGYMLLPGLINLLIFIGIGVGAWLYSDGLTNDVMAYFNIDNETGIAILFWTTLIIIRLLVLFVFYFIYKYIILILMSPALALFAEKIEYIETGKKVPFQWRTFINNIFRGIAIAMKNLVKEVFLMLLIMLLNFTLVLSPFVPFLLFIIQSYYYGFSMMDYRNEIQGLTMKESSQLIWKHKGLALGNGAVFSIMLLIPFFGALFAPMIALNAALLSMQDIEA